MKEKIIREYLAKIDFKRDNWSYRVIQEDVKRLIGETPAIDVIYKKDVLINEGSGIAMEIKNINSVIVIFTETNDKIQKLEIKVD